jgi:hypothetical protein
MVPVIWTAKPGAGVDGQAVGATVPMLSRLSDSWFFSGFFSGRCPRAGPTFEGIKLIVKAPFLLQGTAPPGPENVVDVDHFGRRRRRHMMFTFGDFRELLQIHRS